MNTNKISAGLTIALWAIAVLVFACPASSDAQTQQCGGYNQPQCPPPAPVMCTIPGLGNLQTICRAMHIGPW
jgi:hypothetical protein